MLTLKIPTARKGKSKPLKPPKKDILLPPTCRIRLPPEIMAVVLSYLPTESAVALSLTCKTFYFKYFNSVESIPKPLSGPASCPVQESREVFLTWLERDIPSLAYCHYCDRLHPWRSSGSLNLGKRKHNQTTVQTPTSFTHQDYCKARKTKHGSNIIRHTDPYDLGPWMSFPLSFYTAHIAMNAVRYGADHGPSLRELEVNKIGKDVMYRVTDTSKWELKVINDELYVHGSSSFRHMRGSAKGLYEFLLGNAQRLTCRHMVVVPFPDVDTGMVKEGRDSDWRPGCPQAEGGHFVFEDLMIPAFHYQDDGTRGGAGRRRSPRPIFRIGTHPVRSCEICWTDFQISIQTNEARPDEIMQVDRLPVGIRRTYHVENPTTRYLPMSATPEEVGRSNRNAGIQAVRSSQLQPQDVDERDYTITIEQWVRLGACKNLREEVPWKARISCHGEYMNLKGRVCKRGWFKRPGDIVRRWYLGADEIRAILRERRRINESAGGGGSQSRGNSGVFDMDEDENMPLWLWRKLRGARYAEGLKPVGFAHEHVLGL